MFRPRYSITASMAQNLMAIQHAATAVDQLPLPPPVLQELQKQSRETTVILSTKVEGNRLDERAKRQAMYTKSQLAEGQAVSNLAKAMGFLERAEKRQLPVTGDLIKELHAITRVIPYGRRPRLSAYRTEQNQVGRRNEEGFYLPPEAGDVPALMEDLVAWINAPSTLGVPAPSGRACFSISF